MEKINMVDEEKQLAGIIRICEQTSRGVWKRIDENRELLEFLYQHAPDLFERFGFIRSWIQSNDDFFTELAEAVGVDNIFDWEKYGRGVCPRQYPRPWPEPKECHTPASSLRRSEQVGEQ